MNYLEPFNAITTFIFDVDGVLTNSELLITESGELLRTMNARDGFAMRLAIESDYNICIITGGKSEGVILRLKGLGIHQIYSGIRDKVSAFEEYCDTYDINPGNVLYMGDDLPDYDVMRLVAMPTCPSDAAHEIKAIAQYVSPAEGGRGCVRDVIERVMRMHGKWLATEELGII
jgi:3-deoxy-D-manno-octulosonate 8-phosphate phosphatase (KDO 8-P phosphatase)